MEQVNIVRCCFPTIPQVYSNALSYQEALCELQGAINNVISILNTYTPVTEEYVKEYVANALRGINDEISEFKSSVNQKLSQYESDNAEFEAEIRNDYETFTNSINSKVDGIIQSVKEENEIFYGFIVTWFNEEIQKIINNLSDSTYVTNPVYNSIGTLKNTLSDMYYGITRAGVTAYEYDKLKLSADKYDNKAHKAIDYDTGARFIFHEKIYGVFSAFTGLFSSVEQAIFEIYAKMQENAKTAQEYDALALTATAYDGKILSAYNYNWNFV